MLSNAPIVNWLDSLKSQIDFYRRGGQRRRIDPEFDWSWYERRGSGLLQGTKSAVKRLLKTLDLRQLGSFPVAWVEQHAQALWSTRNKLVDETSRSLFDASIIMRVLDHRYFYFPRIDFDDLVEVHTRQKFEDARLPHDYLGVALYTFELTVTSRDDIPRLHMITTELQLRLLNSYRQYLIRRDGRDLSPIRGDVVIDCGACIGEVSLLFAGLVGTSGAVHLFDPIPLHTRFCEEQVRRNPALAGVMRINSLAVSDRSHDGTHSVDDLKSIDPGSVDIDSFPATSIDDYVARMNIDRVDFIKMDIEGSELSALSGAASTISRFKPTLAISGYHKPEDMWELPERILAINPDYQLSFGHHSPVSWESVFYAKSRS